MNKYIGKDDIERFTKKIVSTYGKELSFMREEGARLPTRKTVYDILDDLFQVLFPGYTGTPGLNRDNVGAFVGKIMASLATRLHEEIATAYAFCENSTMKDERLRHESARKAVSHLLERIPSIREILITDIQAAYDGDPAAKSFDEIIVSYPCIEAIATYRLAHELTAVGVPLIPRLMTERAHSLSGIDIHPRAKIGESFFIDHGTGVVIGETTVIGKQVKIYQGVTLGALSFPKDERGRIIKGHKRHPTIEDRVTIYAEATILGGDTVIGHDSVIGGNVWITRSVDAWTKVEAALDGQRIVPRQKAKMHKEKVV